jgi:putative ABC transport system permease protein
VLLQIQYAKDRPVGFDRENIIHVPIRTEGLANADYNSLRHELLRSGGVEDMAKSDFPITGAMAGDASLTWEGKDPALRPLVALNSCTHDFPKTNGFQFVAGRDFSREYSTDTTAVIINEMAAALFAPGANALGKKIKFGYGIEREVIGIIKDQVRWTPFGKQSPHIYYIKYDGTGYLTIRLNTRLGTREALNKVEAVIRKFDAEASFDYEFLDEDYAKLFENEERLGKLASLFAVLTIIISCIGIFGLASFAATQRTKEIGIRKILGASIASIWKMLSGDFVRLVLVAVVVATPLAYYFAHEWLQQYEYRIDVPVWVFVITGLLCLIITLISVSYQSIAVAISNPVKSLRSE